jgi:hypothetical protein
VAWQCDVVERQQAALLLGVAARAQRHRLHLVVGRLAQEGGGWRQDGRRRHRAAGRGDTEVVARGAAGVGRVQQGRWVQGLKQFKTSQ